MLMQNLCNAASSRYYVQMTNNVVFCLLCAWLSNVKLLRFKASDQREAVTA